VTVKRALLTLPTQGGIRRYNTLRLGISGAQKSVRSVQARAKTPEMEPSARSRVGLGNEAGKGPCLTPKKEGAWPLIHGETSPPEGAVQSNTTQHNTTQHNTTQNKTKQNKTKQNKNKAWSPTKSRNPLALALAQPPRDSGKCFEATTLFGILDASCFTCSQLLPEPRSMYYPCSPEQKESSLRVAFEAKGIL
jgi:hypothetical protein